MKKIILSPRETFCTKNTEANTIHYSDSPGHGSITTASCSSGIRLQVNQFRLHQPAVITMDNPPHFYGFGFCLSGAFESKPSCMKQAFLVKSGESGFFNFPETESNSQIIKNGRLLQILIYMTPEILSGLTGKDPGQLPSVLMKDTRIPYRAVDKITPLMQATLHQMLNCTYQGITKKLYIEGIILELIAHKIAQLYSSENISLHKQRLNPNEIEQVRHAANLLCLDLESPPNMSDLAGNVGMCRSKLYACFQEVFGTTPFAYLQQKRMETAGNLIKSGAVNVTEAAYSVGYSSLSHFSKAYKKHFGVPPREYAYNR